MSDICRRTLVLGLGNEILGDDGVGLRAARAVVELVGDGVDLAEACVATIDLLPVLAGYERVIVIDAYVSDHEPPGTMVRVTPEELPRGFGYRSLHTLPFREMLEFGRELGLDMPREMVIHGLCVADPATFSESFSAPVAESWRRWVEAIAREEFAA